MNVFVSYRRADSQATAGRLAQFLDGISGVDDVFLDVDGISPGENFEQKIQQTLDKVSHVFVLIGPQWAGTSGGKELARIFESDDMVRRETLLALGSRARVIPILLDGTRMPGPKELPAELKALSTINAFELRTAHFDADMDTLLDSLLGNHAGRGSRWRDAPLTPLGIAMRVAGGTVAGAALLMGVAFANQLANGDEGLAGTLRRNLGLADDDDALGLLWMICIAMLCLGAIAPFMSRLLRRKG